MLLAICAASGATVLGLVVLGASAVGAVGLRVAGFASLTVGGFLAGAIRRHRQREAADGEALAQLATASTELERGNPTAAASAASQAVGAAATSRTRNRALITLAWAALGQGYPERAKAVLDRVAPPHALDVYCLAAVEAARGRTELAIQALEVARTAGALNCDAAKLLVECHLRAFGIERAVLMALRTRQALGRENCQLVINAARLAGAHAEAAKLAAVLRDGSDVASEARPSPNHRSSNPRPRGGASPCC
jgi:hypothetical protein